MNQNKLLLTSHQYLQAYKFATQGNRDIQNRMPEHNSCHTENHLLHLPLSILLTHVFVESRYIIHSPHECI